MTSAIGFSIEVENETVFVLDAEKHVQAAFSFNQLSETSKATAIAKARGWIDGYHYAKVESGSPASEWELAKLIYMTNERFSFEGTDEHFALYDENPEGLGHLQMTVFKALRIAKAVFECYRLTSK